VNPDLKLLPGMTATISFETDTRSKVMRIPNAALRFYPDIKQVREQDRKILEGTADEQNKQEQDAEVGGRLTADERVEARRKRSHRHVWVVDGAKLKAVAVTTGLSDNKFTELVEGDLKLGDRLVMGIEPKIKGF
jgi:HlyD family secretion protein